MFKGCFVSIVTPFKEDGRIDYETLEKLIDYQVQSKVDGIVCLADTGEGPTLSEKERDKIIQLCLSRAKNKVKIIVGSSANSTHSSLLFAKRAKELAADGLLINIPLSSEKLISHFEEVAKVDLPIILSDSKEIQFENDIFSELEKIPQIVAIKTCDAKSIAELKKKYSLPLLTGCDKRICQDFKEGVCGMISDAANIIPHHWKIMVDFCMKGDFEKAEKIALHYQKLIHSLNLEISPLSIKYALSLIEKCSPTIRLPFIKLSDQVKQKLQKALFQTSILEAFEEKNLKLKKI